MKAFLAGVAAAAVIAIVAALVLADLGLTSASVFSSQNIRL